MHHLWTPWRMQYIQRSERADKGCILCGKAAAGADEAEHILTRGNFIYATLNKYPYNNGHLMLVPYEHVPSQEALPLEALTEIMLMANQAMAVLRAVYAPPAFNLGANIGTPAGAGIAEHYHFHIVPRWPSDANFMSTIAETRVIPDTLDNTYKLLKDQWILLSRD